MRITDLRIIIHHEKGGPEQGVIFFGDGDGQWAWLADTVFGPFEEAYGVTNWIRAQVLKNWSRIVV